jgi:hypothetical protein
MKCSISRRMALVRGSKLVLLLSTGAALPVKAFGQAGYADPEAADKWLYPLLHAPGAVAGALHMGRFRDRIYYLDQKISWKPGPGQTGPEITVPAGFVTDLASIPRLFWSLFPTDGVYTFPAIVHDFMYWTQTHPREVADEVFRQGMEDMKVPSADAWAIHTAVRAGGGNAWDKNAQLKAQGERRLLVKFPDDPTTNWSDWKKQADCCAVI